MYWSDLRADTGTLFFPDKIQTKHSQIQLHKEESLFFVKEMLVAPLSTAGVSDEVAQELQMPICPQMLEDVEEPMLARPATLKDPGTPDQIVMEHHNLTHFPSQSWCKICASNLEDVIHSIENSRKSMQLSLNCNMTTGTWETEALCRLRASSWEQTPLLETSKKMDTPYVVAATAKWCA